MKPPLDDDIQPILTTPAHRFFQGGRYVYAFALDLATLDRLLPGRVDDDVVKDANRQLTVSHAKRIQDYLESRDDWVLGTLMLGISPDALEFVPYQASTADVPLAVGQLRINTAHNYSMKMFDGQHRRRAIKDALNHLESDSQRQDKANSLRGESVPILLYVEDEIHALRQMFADAARTKTIERNTVAQFDLRDAFNLAALWLEENSGLFGGRVEMEHASVSRTSQGIIAINQLAATLKTVVVGYNGRVSRDTNDQYLLNLDDLYERCWVWADDFMPSARDEYEGLMAGEIDNSEIPQRRSTTLAYSAPVIRLLAGCYHEWVKDGTHWRELAAFLRSASLEPATGKGSLLVDTGLIAPGGITPFPGMQAATLAIEQIVRQAREFRNARLRLRSDT